MALGVPVTAPAVALGSAALAVFSEAATVALGAALLGAALLWRDR